MGIALYGNVKSQLKKAGLFIEEDFYTQKNTLFTFKFIFSLKKFGGLRFYY